jgi:hypothetical protein
VPNYTAVDGVALSASTYNANVRDQVVTTCTNATRPAGTEGQWIFETDTGRMFVHDGSAFVQFGGVVAGASFTHNPQVDQGATTNISKTLSYSQYQIMGNLCWWSFGFTLLAGGTAGSAVTLTTPVTMTASGMGVGGGRIFDNSAPLAYVGLWRAGSTTTISCFTDGANTSAAWGQNPNIAAATSDGFYGMVMLPIA